MDSHSYANFLTARTLMRAGCCLVGVCLAAGLALGAGVTYLVLGW